MKREEREHAAQSPAVWLTTLAFAADASSAHARTLLTMASESDDPEVLRATAASPRCPAIALRRLTDRLLPNVKRDAIALEIMIAVAWNSNTTTRTMEKIAESHHQDLRTVLCFNPATPEYLLMRLGETANGDMGYHLAQHPSTPPALLEMLSHHSDTSVRDAVLSNPKTPKATLNRLMGQVPDQIRLHAAARNPAISPIALADWATSPRYSVRRIVAANPSLPVYLMEQLAWDGDQRAQISIASQPRIPEHLAQALASNLTSLDTRIALASNPNIPKHIALALLLDPSEKVRAAVVSAQHGIPVQALTHLAYEDSAPIVHSALAKRQELPVPPLIRLVDASLSGEHSSAVSAAQRPSQIETEVAFALHYHSDLQARMALYRRADCPSEALAHALADPDANVRASVAINPAATEQMLKTLAGDPDATVHLLATTHPQYR